MEVFLNTELFEVRGVVITWLDVLVFAKCTNRFDVFEEETRARIRALALATKAGNAPASDVVKAALTEFRYEHDLIAAEDAEKWLTKHCLSSKDLTEYIKSTCIHTGGEKRVAGSTISEEMLRRALHRDGVCSGTFQEFLKALTSRLAVSNLEPVAYQGSSANNLDSICDLVEFYALLGVTPSSDADVALTYQKYQMVEQEYQKFLERVKSVEALNAAIASNTINWLTLEMRLCSFSSLSIANEAKLCVNCDGDEFERVAELANVELCESRQLLSECATYLSQMAIDSILSAHPGELVGPLDIDGEFILIQVIEKITPSLNIPVVRERACVSVVCAAEESAKTSEIKWCDASRDLSDQVVRGDS